MEKQRGGARPGAGRKPGTRNKATMDRDALIRETSVKLKAAGITNEGDLTPAQIAAMTSLEVMNHTMVRLAVAGNWIGAADIASRIAPFRFARLTSTKIDAVVRRSVEDMDDDELMALAGDDDAEHGDA